MLPHPYTAEILMEFEYKERLREAARNRLSASAQRSGPSVFAHMRTASNIAVSCLNGLLLRVAGRRDGTPFLPWRVTKRQRAVPTILNHAQGS